MKTNSSNKTTDNPTSLNALTHLFKRVTGADIEQVIPITGSASARQYYHLVAGQSRLIGVIGSNIAENQAFLSIGKTLGQHGVRVPYIHATSDDSMLYLIDDLGDKSLYDVIKSEGFSNNVMRLCMESIDQLIDMQIIGNENIDFSVCYPVSEMSGDSVKWDLDYFKYCFLKTIGAEIDEPRLESEFKQIAASIDASGHRLFVHRDFQSRNIMIFNDIPWIIDFQGARRGPASYDIVSFLWQARVGFPNIMKTKLLEYYITTLSFKTGFNPDDLRKELPIIIIFRLLQVLGAYGFRGLIEQKQRFKTYIPQALSSLNETLDQTADSYPYLKTLIEGILDRFNNCTSLQTLDNRSLTVEISSFSYKKGVPVDTSGNGGGYVFDCRAIHNPGRYDQYKHLNGRDLPVMEFMEYDGEIMTFLEHCKALVDKSVERYIERGFTHLTVAFGCTGGQHRSVYSADHMARHLVEKYGVNVKLTHIEQNITEEYNSAN